MSTAKPLSESKWRKDTMSLIVAGNERTRLAANLLRKSVNDTTGLGWTRKPEDWREIEQHLVRAAEFYSRARRLATHRADEIDGKPSLIGREDKLIDVLAKGVHRIAFRYHDYTELRDTHRGKWFELRTEDGCIMRVSVVFDRIEDDNEAAS